MYNQIKKLTKNSSIHKKKFPQFKILRSKRIQIESKLFSLVLCLKNKKILTIKSFKHSLLKAIFILPKLIT